MLVLTGNSIWTSNNNSCETEYFTLKYWSQQRGSWKERFHNVQFIGRIAFSLQIWHAFTLSHHLGNEVSIEKVFITFSSFFHNIQVFQHSNTSLWETRFYTFLKMKYSVSKLLLLLLHMEFPIQDQQIHTSRENKQQWQLWGVWVSNVLWAFKFQYIIQRFHSKLKLWT